MEHLFHFLTWEISEQLKKQKKIEFLKYVEFDQRVVQRNILFSKIWRNN